MSAQTASSPAFLSSALAQPGVYRHPSMVHEDLWVAVDDAGRPAPTIPLQRVTLFSVPGKSMHLSFTFASPKACASFCAAFSMQNIMRPEASEPQQGERDYVCTLADITNVRGMIALAGQHGMMSDDQNERFGKSIRRAYNVYGR